jgi:hypothetical protein
MLIGRIAGLRVLNSLFVLFFSVAAAISTPIFSSAAVIDSSPRDQHALLSFSNGLERLVIDFPPSLNTTNENWLMTFPSQPTIEALSASFFGNLERSFQPLIHFKPSSWWIFFAIFTAVLSYVIRAFRRKTFLPAAILLLILVAIITASIAPGDVYIRAADAGSAGSETGQIAGQTAILSTHYKITRLSEKHPAAVLSQLRQAGFEPPPSALSLLSDRSAEGFVFLVVIKKNRNEELDGNEPLPLAFTFKTPEPVLPGLITEDGDETAPIQLYVFGAARAEADGLLPEFCGEVNERQSSSEDLVQPPPRFSIDTEIARFALPAKIATKMRATVSAKQMRNGARIRWAQFQQIIPHVYSFQAAASRALNWMVGIASAGFLIWQTFGRKWKSAARSWFLTIVGAIAVVAALAVGCLTDVRMIAWTAQDWRSALNEVEALEGAIKQYTIDRNKSRPLTFAELKRELPSYYKGHPELKNPLTSRALRDEPTPGNLTLENRTNSVRVFWYDLFDQSHLVAQFDN